jgi:L-ascorbate metabolism protein UlaG (beta-lactamase superfamily)
LLSKNNPQVKIISGLNMTPIISSLFKKENMTEMGWHQQFTDEENNLNITYLPTRHWCRRFLTDTNRRLWGAFVFETGNKTIYFGGDSGYGNHFKSTAELFPSIDYAFLGIGAFAPVWFMESNHMSPSAAFDAFKDLQARRFVPMHFGTFDLSDEPLGEPLRLLKGIHEEHGLNGEVLFSEIGRAVHV